MAEVLVNAPEIRKTTRVDATMWALKSARIKAVVYPAMAKIVAQKALFVYSQTKANVMGSPSAAPQTEPVPRRTYNLFKSVKQKMVNPVQYKVFSDDSIAPYNKYVHYGTRKMRPRRFLGDVLTQHSRRIHKEMGNEFRAVIRKVGL